jgi:hypothetical protein
MHEHEWVTVQSVADGTFTRRCSCGEVQVSGGGLPPGFPPPVTIHNPSPLGVNIEKVTADAARAISMFADAQRGINVGALRESMQRARPVFDPNEKFSVYYPPDEVASDFGVSETLKAEITAEEALQVILNDITADMLNGTEAVRERAAHWVTELTTKAARIVKISEGEDDGR